MKKKLQLLDLALLSMASTSSLAASFGEDVAFLRQHTPVIVLSDRAGLAQIALAPAWQGRVMTSTAGGDAGPSYGWINRELIASGQRQPHIHVWGGEDRLWLGPEGGQFSIFFAKGVPFDLEHWFTPAPLDTEAFAVISQGRDSARFRQGFGLTNFTGTTFQVRAQREVRLLPARQTWARLGLEPLPAVRLVGFESRNTLVNAGTASWQKDTGLLSIWILGMFNPSPATTIVVPLRAGAEAELGKAVTADYFGLIPPERLAVKDNVVYFSGDGQYRSKIGISPKRSRAVLGSYDAAQGLLTIVQFTQPPAVTDYVNSLWQLQDQPYGGDAANSYNDGPAAPGAKPLGPFYELESSSPAAPLASGRRLEHVHRTMHLTGAEPHLDVVARAILGVGIDQIKTALPRPASR
jgi:hypothetical protein